MQFKNSINAGPGMIMNRTQSVNRGAARASGKARRALLSRTVAIALAVASFACVQQTASAADTRAQVKRMFDRLTGTPPSPAVLDALTTSAGAGSQQQLVNTALQIMNPSNAYSSPFYSVTLKNFATPWTNRDRDVFAPLNDYTATVIGYVRDNKDFRGILSDNVLYVGSSGAYSTTDNNMYETLESSNADLRTVLVERPQSSLNGLPAEATAGVITSRAASQAFFIAGTNRAMFRFTLINHLCRDMEQVHDTTRPPDRIRQDVTRSPGGDSSVFLNNCIGCHSGMDPMAQAFAYYNFDETAGKLMYTQDMVQPKYKINSDNFKPGYVTPDDQWENRWRLPGHNTVIGWASTLPGKGKGAKSLGQELAASDAFAECQVEKVFRSVCFRSPSDTDDYTQVGSSTASFKNGGNLKQVFAETAAYCAGN